VQPQNLTITNRSTASDIAAQVDLLRPGYVEHAARVQALVSALLSVSGNEESFDADAIKTAALLHDIGKAAISRDLLDRPGRLEPDELAIVRQHAFAGSEYLDAFATYANVAILIRHHHEWWNGNGYPCQLGGESIPYGSRLIGVADAYDAMTSNRPYQSALPVDRAREELVRCSGTQFDPDIIGVFIEHEKFILDWETAGHGAVRRLR